MWTAGARPVDGLRPPTARTRTRPHFAHRSGCDAHAAAGSRSALNNHKKMFIKINGLRGWKRGRDHYRPTWRTSSSNKTAASGRSPRLAAPFVHRRGAPWIRRARGAPDPALPRVQIDMPRSSPRSRFWSMSATCLHASGSARSFFRISACTSLGWRLYSSIRSRSGAGVAFQSLLLSR